MRAIRADSMAVAFKRSRSSGNGASPTVRESSQRYLIGSGGQRRKGLLVLFGGRLFVGGYVMLSPEMEGVFFGGLRLWGKRGAVG